MSRVIGHEVTVPYSGAEQHVLALFDDAIVRVEIDEEGHASINFEQRGDSAEERDYPISFDAENWNEINAFWRRVTDADR